MKFWGQRGIQSVVLRVFIQDTASATGAGKTGLTEASSGLVISTLAENEASSTKYTAAASNVETITTLGTYQAPTTNKCRFKEVSAADAPGVYEIHLADARYNVANARTLQVHVFGMSGAAHCPTEIQLGTLNPNDSAWSTVLALITTINDKIGAFAGSGLNTILGFFRAIARKTAALTPSDMGGTFDNTTDSMEAATDSAITDQNIRDAMKLAPSAGSPVAGSIDKHLDDIQTKSDLVPAAPAQEPTVAAVQADVDDIQGRLPAALVGGRMDANMSAIAGDAAAATKLKDGTRAVGKGTVDTAGFTPTTTQFESSTFTYPNADQLANKTVVFLGGTNDLVGATITATSLVSGRTRFTVSVMPAAPANAAEFIVV